MKFPMDRPVKIVMLGAGGTGGYVAPYLFRLLHMLDIERSIQSSSTLHSTEAASAMCISAVGSCRSTVSTFP